MSESLIDKANRLAREAVTEIAAGHNPSGTNGAYCLTCGTRWPCPTVTLVQDAEEAISEAKDVIEQDVCPFDCDSCHDEDCPCDRLGCAGSEAPGAR
jgi:hypothetical protein